ncbi:hypothetical protein EON66_00460 [archaeon]|nr:MAG: hypothetical protein EON66_00460 [archaeon]
MRAFKLSSRGGRMVVGGAMLCTLGATATWLYCRTVLGLPMKLRMDSEGIWKWMTRTEALCERLKVGAHAMRVVLVRQDTTAQKRAHPPVARALLMLVTHERLRARTHAGC